MKGLKNKMSIKAFCKRGLAVLLACAMIAPGVGPVMQTQAANISAGDEWITTANGLEVKISARYHGENGAGVMAGAEQTEQYVSGTASTADISTLVDGKIDTGVIFRGALDSYPDGLEVGDYVQVEFKNPIMFTGVEFAFQNTGTDFFNDSTLSYTTDGSIWIELGTIASATTMRYQSDELVRNVRAIRLTNNVYERAWVRLREITVNTLISPVYEKYVPGTAANGKYIEDGTYAIVGAHKGYSLNNAVNSAVNTGEKLTYISVANNIENNIFTRINKNYEWAITNVDGGYKLCAADGERYLTLTSSDSPSGATLTEEPQVIEITENTNYTDSVAIGTKIVTENNTKGYLNHRDNAVGTWTQPGAGSAWYLYKFGYKISDLFVSEIFSNVWEQEIYTEDSWAAYETAKEVAEEAAKVKLAKLYATKDEAQTVYEEVYNELVEAVELLEMVVTPVGEKLTYSEEELVVETGTYAIIGARVGSSYSENKAVTSTKTLTYTNVADKIVNDILMLPENAYLWEIEAVEGGYNLSAKDGDGYLYITDNNNQNGVTVAADAQLITIEKSIKHDSSLYANSMAISHAENNATGYLNDRSGKPGTWTGVDVGSCWYLYKLGYKVSEELVSEAISDVEDESAYKNGWENYTAAKTAAGKVYATVEEAKDAYNALVVAVDALEKNVVVTAGSVRNNGVLGNDGKPEKDPCRIMDGNIDNNWLSDPNSALVDSWVNFELPKAEVVDGLKLYYGAEAYVHKAYEVLVSADGANWTKVCEGTFAQTSGEKTIKFKPVETKHIRLVPTAKYGSELAIWEAEILYAEELAKDWFSGGALRMDYADTYDKTCLRFMYTFPTEFNGMTVDATTEDGDGGSWKWTYGTTAEMTVTKGVADGKWNVNNNMVESNIVFTNIGKSNYNDSLYTRLAVTYSDATGANTLTVYDSITAQRSVNDIANAIKVNYKDEVDENKVKQYNYALGILGESAE